MFDHASKFPLVNAISDYGAYMRATLIAVVVVAVAVAGCGDDAPGQAPEVGDPIAFVDPTIGTGGLGYAYGSCFVGAAAPHGLAKPGPDTDGTYGTVDFQHFSGYYADDDKIQGFSQLHLHGAGATDYGVLSLMPTLAFDPSKTSVVDYEDTFAKADEHAQAGGYRVTLGSGIAVELTASQRVAVHRYTFPSAGSIVIDLDKTLNNGGTVDAAAINVDDNAHEVTGQLHHTGGMSGSFGGYTVYFVARATTPWTSHQVWSMASPTSDDASAQGTQVGAVLNVPAGQLQLAIGLSLVSSDGARANLAAEVPTIDFDTVQAQTEDAWRGKLNAVLLTGGSPAQRRIFYTSLYHAFLMPSVIADVDGSYQLHGQPVTVATGYQQMSDLSLWDSYRTVSTLYDWLAPQSAHDTVRSLIGFGHGLGVYPKWPLAIGDSGYMIGASSEIVIADAVARGVQDTNADQAWPVLRSAAMDPNAPADLRGGRPNILTYMQYGYIPSSSDRSVSETTEYAHDDFALAHLAAALGHDDDHDTLLTRSQGWRQLWDPSTGFLRAKNAFGAFADNTYFDPTEFSNDYTEADAWQSLWMAGLHDPDGLVSIMGGADKVIDKLNMFFALTLSDWEASDPTQHVVQRDFYWGGNEPDLNASFVYAQVGKPSLTQQWVRWCLDTQYSDLPTGIQGNDDGGTMGSWYVLASLGLFPISGSDGYVIGAPLFPQARITVGGHELLIVAEGVGDDAPYVQSVDLDGVAVSKPLLTQAQLATAKTLHFVMGTSASSWGE